MSRRAVRHASSPALLCDFPARVLNAEEQFVLWQGEDLFEPVEFAVDGQLDADGGPAGGCTLVTP